MFRLERLKLLPAQAGVVKRLRARAPFSLTLGILFCALSSLYSAPALAQSKEHPFSEAFKAKVHEALFENGVKSARKIESFRGVLATQHREISQLLTEEPRKFLSTTSKPTLDAGILVTIELAQGTLKYIESAPDEPQLLELAQNFFQLNESIKTVGRRVFIDESIAQTMNSWKDWEWGGRELKEQSPSSNLWQPDFRRYFSEAEILQRRHQGFDDSVLDPSPDSPIWRRPRAEAFKIENLILSKGTPLIDGLSPETPVGSAVLQSIDKRRTAPKLNIQFNTPDGPRPAVFKFGREVNSGPTSSALLSFVGYSTDIFQHVTNFKIHLGSMTHEDFRRELVSYYSFDTSMGGANLDNHIRESGNDEAGAYLIFKEGVIDIRPKEITRLGSWSVSGNGFDSFREVRGLTLFNLWIGNIDAGERGRNRMVLRKYNDGSQRMFYIQDDSAASFGALIPEKLDAFSWNLIKSQSGKKIEFDYQSNHPNPLKGKLAFDDGRWMTRLIARLTRQQIEDAVRLGSWPDSVAKLLVEKLIHRRNQLVTAFRLAEEFPPMAVDTNLSTSDGAVANGVLKQGVFDDHQLDFGNYGYHFSAPMRELLKRLALKALLGGIDALNGSRFDPIELGFDTGVIASILIDANRNIYKNPAPTSDKDRFLVEDIFGVGLRLGLGIIISGDASYRKVFRLVYPAPTREAAEKGNGMFFHLMMPLSLSNESLPKQYVLMSENLFEARGKISTALPGLPLNLGGGLTKVVLGRTILDHKSDDKVIVQVDKSKHWEPFFRVTLSLIDILDVPLLTAIKEVSGKLSGKTFVIPKEAAAKMDLNKLFWLDSAHEVAGAERVVDLDVSYKGNQVRSNLLGIRQSLTFVREEAVKRTDSLIGEVTDTLQIRRGRLSSWSFLGRAERFDSRIQYVETANEQAEGSSFGQLKVNFLIDDANTATKEFKQYLRFLNGLSPFTLLVELTPELYIQKKNSSKNWSELLVAAELRYPESAVQKILNISEADIIDSLSLTLDRKREDIRFSWGHAFESDSDLSESEAFWRLIKGAKLEPDRSKKISRFAAAMAVGVKRSGHAYSSRLFNMLNRYLGPEKFCLEAGIFPAEGVENQLPGGNEIFRQYGNCVEYIDNYVMILPLNASESYNMFRWIKQP